MIPRLFMAALALGLVAGPAHAVPLSPYATEPISYTPGDDVIAGFDVPENAIGEPVRANVGQFPGDAGVFNSIFEPESLVSVGSGGELTVKFDHHVLDDPLNPFGIDLLIFGNSFLIAVFGEGDPFAAGSVSAEPGVIWVSQYGIDYVNASSVMGVYADGLFPTVGYLDTPGPFDSGGSIESDFTRPVDPSLTAASFTGLTYDEITALYAGSGGGVGIDLGLLGLDWIEYVRIEHRDLGDGKTTEVAGFADVAAVPEPAGPALIGLALFALCRARRRRGRT